MSSTHGYTLLAALLLIGGAARADPAPTTASGTTAAPSDGTARIAPGPPKPKPKPKPQPTPQPAPQPAPAAAAPGEAIVVTGTRIARPDYAAPNPLCR